ncbi:deoxyribose-phosphate aldolase [Effusibacillus dendaii]
MQIRQLCGEAVAHHFASVCINPLFVPIAVEELKGTDVKVCTVVGFPLGATSSAVKSFETKTAVQQGASELDMVIPVGLLKSNRLIEVLQDIESVVKAAKETADSPAGTSTVVKVILETCLLTDREKVIACLLAQRAGADFVKTSTGFSHFGALIEDIQLMRAVVGPTMGVKASGGIRNRDAALQMLKAGATRIGASASVAIVAGQSSTAGY